MKKKQSMLNPIKNMKNNCKNFFVLCSISLVMLFIGLSFKNSLSNTISQNGNERNQSFTDGKSDQGNIEPIVFDNFELVEGLEIADLKGVSDSYYRRRVIQLCDGSKKGRAENYFFEHSAKYDITLFYVDGVNGKSGVDVIINDRKIGNIMFGLSNSFKEKTIPDINIQQWSKIVLEFIGDGNERCRLEKLIITPKGAFEGEITHLMKPKTLNIFETNDEQLMGRRVFSDFIQAQNDSLEDKRMAELASLKNPSEWRARQMKTREMLHKFFGEFPERTPLNARIVGKLERTHYTIEKVIFESQPKFYVTANLYVPKGREFPLPGVVFPCGHSDDAKARDVYHMSGLGLVLKGYVVLIFDPIGQGERSEYSDNNTKQPLVLKGVDQHWYVGRPAFLVDWTLSGLRTWDAIRAVDYLVSRPEVDKDKLAAVGCSGGGQMAMLVTAVDERIKVCAASHPGGPMENTYLLGVDWPGLVDKEIFSLIPPRPLRIIVGNESGEEPYNREKLDDMQLFYEGLKAGKQCGDMDLVPGVHSMSRSNRESAYEWLNKWLDKEAEGKAEAILEPEKIETLWCTESGNTIFSLGGETGQTLNAKRANQIYKQEKDLTKLKERISARIGLKLPQNEHALQVHLSEIFSREDLSIEKLTYESENGIIIPTLLIKPKNVKPGSPIYIYASDKGKPDRFEDSDIPFLLAKNGFIVLAIDVRGIGEISPVPPFFSNQFTGYTPLLEKQDQLEIQCTSFGRTTLGMRTFDMLRGIDFLNSRDDLKGRKIVTVGEGLGGLWALLASVYDPRIDGVVTIGTLPSYKLLITNQYYNVRGYFYVPGALRDFDIPDLTRLVSPKPQVWIDPVNALGEKLNFKNASSIIGTYKNLQIITPDNRPTKDILQPFIGIFN
jgi:cephalosporin-C deacetylase-like acetyl esterase